MEKEMGLVVTRSGELRIRGEQRADSYKTKTFPVTRQRRPGNEMYKMTDAQETCQEKKLRALIPRKIFFPSSLFLKLYLFEETDVR